MLKAVDKDTSKEEKNAVKVGIELLKIGIQVAKDVYSMMNKNSKAIVSIAIGIAKARRVTEKKDED